MEKQPIKQRHQVLVRNGELTVTGTVKHSFELRGHIFMICSFMDTLSTTPMERVSVFHHASGWKVPISLDANKTLIEHQEHICTWLEERIKEHGAESFEQHLKNAGVANTTTGYEPKPRKPRAKKVAPVKAEPPVPEQKAHATDQDGKDTIADLTKKLTENTEALVEEVYKKLAEAEQELESKQSELEEEESAHKETEQKLEERDEEILELEYYRDTAIFPDPTGEELEKMEILRDLAHNTTLFELEVLERIAICLRGGATKYITAPERPIKDAGNLDKKVITQVIQITNNQINQ